MAEQGLLGNAFIYLLAAMVAVPIAKRLGLGSVLGYLIAGGVIGPSGLALLGQHSSNVMHFAEFGVVLMLFVVGLELQPSTLWRLRIPILGMGGAQVIGTAVVVGSVCFASGLAVGTAITVGLIAAMSSTAIALQSLQERELDRSAGGQASFAVLLFQDIAVIPILALLPLLATSTPSDSHGASISPIAAPAAIVGIIIGGRLLLRPLFRFVAAARSREAFTATALVIAIGTTLAMQAVGLSAALGTFLAGVVLADSEYRHQLESDIEPFKGLLLGVFFISVGAGIDFSFIASHFGLIVLLVTALISGKALVLYAVGRAFRLAPIERALFVTALAQGGEFAFVLISFALQLGILGEDVARPFIATIALSMGAAPMLFIIYQRYVAPKFCSVWPRLDRAADTIEESNPVLIAGFGGFGNVVGRFLRANDIETTVLDLDANRVDVLRRLGLKVFFGDATRLDLLESAGASKAKIFIIGVESRELSLQMVELVQRHFPHLKIFARARSRSHAYELVRHGVHYVCRDTLGSSLDLGVEALKELGKRAFQAERAARRFEKHESASLYKLSTLSDDRTGYFAAAREAIAELERQMRDDLQSSAANKDKGWDPLPTRSDAVN